LSKSKGLHALQVRQSLYRPLAFGTIGALVFACLAAVLPAAQVQADTLITSSAKTITAAESDPNVATSPFPDLKVTVSQTANLVSQGITISYSGLKKSVRPGGGDGGSNFLQVAQCWGEDPNNPGHPDRTTCQYGLTGNAAASRDGFVTSNTVAKQDSLNSFRYSDVDNVDYVSVPFKAVTGEVINSIQDDGKGNKSLSDSINVNENQFFTPNTTNFLPWAGADDSGVGTAKFEIQTVMQSPGLGCGTPVVTGTTAVGQSCWLVFIPRGTHDNGQNYITTSGLFWGSWQHNIAVKLDFRPVGVRCAIGGSEHQISGSELVSAAVASWQPKLCEGSAGSAFVLSTGNEPDALASELTNADAPLALTSEPLSGLSGDPLLYAPITVSGVTISFAIDRYVKTRGKISQAYKDANLSAFQSINITPRLLAKLLTNSYLDSLPPGDKSYMGYKGYLDPGPNAANITRDPDFLSVNDAEWQYQSIVGVGISDLVTPIGRSDLADRLWTYIMSDADARSFLEGAADPWGMRVNPWYSTDAMVNPSGTGLSVPRRDFPKADPLEKPDTTKTDPVLGTAAINLVTWRPYVSDFETGAYRALRGDANVLGLWDTSAVPPAFKKSPGSLQGSQRVLALSTAASAAKFQNVTASLLNPAGNFVAPTREAMMAGEAAMVPSQSNPNFRCFDFASESAKDAASAYALTMPVYAAVNPSLLDKSLRDVYANFIRFAATKGQTPGTELGQLPPGYAPLSDGLVAQAMQVASLVSQGLTTIPTVVPTVVPTTSPSVPVTVPTSSSSPSAEGNSSQFVLGAATPADPSSGPLAAAVPVGFILGGLLSFIYGRLGRRKRAKRIK
jgi:hypothetical protein